MKYVIFATAAFLLSACTQSPEQQAKQNARDVISLCWDDQKKKSNDPGTARFIAGTCEMLEDKFRNEYKLNP